MAAVLVGSSDGYPKTLGLDVPAVPGITSRGRRKGQVVLRDAEAFATLEGGLKAEQVLPGARPNPMRRILYNLYPGFQNTSPWEEFLVLNHTPPYISAIPEITHRLLNTGTASSPIPTSRFLILSSDGLSDLCTGPGQQRVLDAWSQNLRRSIGTDTAGKSGNIALRLLWQALGGDDGDSVSRVLTLEMDTSWIDDTSIVVQSL
ncbi:hypothetical protein FIBSPDRAFT_934674 [Athelia psychrophila]|uniref:PPM-type phosphatase domain-containing protein n=1 Tax=Athelia psychrophila TaxID=1759441 RepID=A0A166F264_9AGAM|nr:hypothetical protein FIBSPDRAFT_934674 [Fibularhizoctonia sp. CBS 109695]